MTSKLRRKNYLQLTFDDSIQFVLVKLILLSVLG